MKQKIEKIRLPLTPLVFYFLFTMRDGKKHGYGIMQRVRKDTDGLIKIGPGSVYGLIKKMLDEGVIEEVANDADADLYPTFQEQNRRYYQLTAAGNVLLSQEIARLYHIITLFHQSTFEKPVDQALEDEE